MPKSERLMVVSASNPATNFSPIGCGRDLLCVTFRTTGFVTPRIVKSPATSAVSSPVSVTLRVFRCNSRAPSRFSSHCTAPETLDLGKPRLSAARVKLAASRLGPRFDNYAMVLQAALDGIGVAVGLRAYVEDDIAAEPRSRNLKLRRNHSRNAMKQASSCRKA